MQRSARARSSLGNAPRVLLGNLAANVIRNVWSFVIIFCGHFTEEIYTFSRESIEGETTVRRRSPGSVLSGRGRTSGGITIAPAALRRFWTMLAHQQGGLLNAAALARALAVDGKTVASYLDLLVDLLLVRRLRPWHGNIRKRLVKSPKVYVRDSGLVHALLGLGDREAVLAHAAAGGSWEGLAIESLIAAAPEGADPHFFRSAAGAEIDLLLKLPGHRQPWAIEVKRGLAPTVERGFHLACEAVRPERRLVVYGGAERFPLGGDVQAISLVGLCEELSAA